MNTRRRTQWAGQFAAAAELCRRGYEVSFTLGNETPDADLFVRCPSGKIFQVDVKSLHKKGVSPVKAKSVKDKLFYVFVLVPDDHKKPCEFSVIAQGSVNDAIKTARNKARTKGRTNYVPGIGGRLVSQFKDAWGILPK